jgi:hypothetical protein
VSAKDEVSFSIGVNNIMPSGEIGIRILKSTIYRSGVDSKLKIQQ